MSRPASIRSQRITSTPSSPTGLKKSNSAVWSALKKPFQGWSKDLLAAKEDLDDEYNFTDCRRHGSPYNFPNVERRGC